LLWQSVWDDQASADRFADAYRQIGAKRARRAVQVTRNQVGALPGVWVVDAPHGVDVSAINTSAMTIVR
jgi:hypothetical protein